MFCQTNRPSQIERRSRSVQKKIATKNSLSLSFSLTINLSSSWKLKHSSKSIQIFQIHRHQILFLYPLARNQFWKIQFSVSTTKEEEEEEDKKGSVVISNENILVFLLPVIQFRRGLGGREGSRVGAATKSIRDEGKRRQVQRDERRGYGHCQQL